MSRCKNLGTRHTWLNEKKSRRYHCHSGISPERELADLQSSHFYFPVNNIARCEYISTT